MSNSVLVAIISVSGSMVVAAVSFLLNKAWERKADWQRRKIEHYRELLTALSGIVNERGRAAEAQWRWADAVNTIALVAPPYVLNALAEFQAEVSVNNPCKTKENHDHLLNLLLLAIRRDIGVWRNENANSFCFRLASGPPEDVASATRTNNQ